LENTAQTVVDSNMSKFLQYKIGYHNNKDGKNYGMCMSVLNKCQNYTYDNKRNYKPNNNVVSEYLYRTMVQIKAAQDTVLSEYAESCISDVTSCLSSNSYESISNKNIAVNACKATIATCMSVNGNVAKQPTPAEMLTWAAAVYGSDSTSIAIQNATACIGAGGSWATNTNTQGGGTCICGSGNGNWVVDNDSNLGICKKS
jgi:putative hemolysin